MAVMASWLSLGEADGAARQILLEMGQTVLPGYVGTTLLLSISVGLGVVLVGLSSAVAVTLFDFRGRRCLMGVVAASGHACVCSGLCLH